MTFWRRSSARFAGSLVSLTLLLTACESTPAPAPAPPPTRPALPQPQGQPAPSDRAPATNIHRTPAPAPAPAQATLIAPETPTRIGRISWLDAATRQAVITLDSRIIDPGQTLHTRDSQGRTTGKLATTTVRRPGTLGATIVEGTPFPGDEVFLLPTPPTGR